LPRHRWLACRVASCLLWFCCLSFLGNFCFAGNGIGSGTARVKDANGSLLPNCDANYCCYGDTCPNGVGAVLSAPWLCCLLSNGSLTGKSFSLLMQHETYVEGRFDSLWQSCRCPNGKVLWQPYWVHAHTHLYNIHGSVSFGSLGQWFRNGGSWMELGQVCSRDISVCSCPNGKRPMSQPYWVFARTLRHGGNGSRTVSFVYLDYWSGNGGSWMEPWYSSCFTGRCHLCCSVAECTLKSSKQHRHGSQPFEVVSVRSPGVTTETRRHLRQVLIFNYWLGDAPLGDGCGSPPSPGEGNTRCYLEWRMPHQARQVLQLGLECTTCTSVSIRVNHSQGTGYPRTGGRGQKCRTAQAGDLPATGT